LRAAVVELVDTQRSGRCVRKGVEVRVLSAADLKARRTRSAGSSPSSANIATFAGQAYFSCMPEAMDQGLDDDARELQELAAWNAAFHEGGGDSPYAVVERKLGAFLYDRPTGRAVHEDLDRALRTALEHGDLALARGAREVLAAFVDESRAPRPDTARLADHVTAFVSRRTAEIAATAERRAQTLAGDEHQRGRAAEGVLHVFENRRSGIEAVGGNAELRMRATLEQAEAMRHAGAATPAFDAFDTDVPGRTEDGSGTVERAA
jgi:hypothetical protein